jgi:hypothetical protein
MEKNWLTGKPSAKLPSTVSPVFGRKTGKLIFKVLQELKQFL